MKRFLSTTAVVLALTGGAAYAQDEMGQFGTVNLEQSDFLASDLIGMRIYNSEAEMEEGMTIEAGAEQEWDDLGEINDIIVSQDGSVTAVVLGIGGFLGIGERDVTVPMSAIRIVSEADDPEDRFLVVNQSREMLEQAPEFERMNDGMAENADNATMDNTAATAVETDAEQAADATAEAADDAADETVEEVDTDAAAADTATGTVVTEPAATDNAAMDNGMDRDLMTRPAVEREGYQDVEMTELTADELEGARLYGTQDEDIGELDELILSDDGQITHVLVDIGGFLGIGERTVRLSFDELQITRGGDANDFRVYVDSNKEALEALPEYED
jgi:hypothetical protein